MARPSLLSITDPGFVFEHAMAHRNALGVMAPLLALMGTLAAKDLATSLAVRTSPETLIQEVEEAISSRKLSGDVASAITMSRLMKRDRLLAAFREDDAAVESK